MAPTLEQLEELQRLLPLATEEERPQVIELITRLAADIHAETPTVDPPFIDSTFPHQAAFLMDTARFEAMVGPRRKGKSSSIARKLIKRGWKHPAGKQGFQSLYIGLTNGQARISFWEPALKPTLRALGIYDDCKIKDAEMVCILPNGHAIYVMGMESTDAIKDRARGTGFATVCVDEAATFVLSLDGIFTDIIQPAVDEVLGTVVLAGTPGYIKMGLFWRVTGSQAHNHSRPDRWQQVDKATATEWSVHRWTSSENPYVRDNIERAMEEMLRLNPAVASLPWFLREKRGLWVLDDTKLVYRYEAGRNDYTELPKRLNPKGWHWGLVCDLGYRPDPLAMAVACWHDNDRTLYVDRMMQRLGMLTRDIVAQVRDYERMYGKPKNGFEFYVIDGAEVRAVEDMRIIHGIPWKAADKRGKSDFIEILNSDMILGRVKIHATQCAWKQEETIATASLAEEYAGLIWDEDALAKGKRQEDPNCANHGCDSVLYLHRHAHASMGEPQAPKLTIGSSEWRMEQERMMEEAAIRRYEQANRNDDGPPMYPDEYDR